MQHNFLASKLHNLTFIKTVLMLCVMVGHSVNFWKGTWFTAITPAYESPVLAYISDFMNAFHIYAFTLVSGYLFYYLKIEQGKYREFKVFLSGKIKRLIVPYIFLCAIWVIPVAEYFFHYSGAEVIKRYVFGTNPNQLWFLLMLFWVYVIAWPLAGVFDKKPVVGGVIVVTLYAVGAVGSRLIPNYFFIWRSCEYVLFFWIGFMMRKLPEVFNQIKWYVWLTVFLVIFVAWETISSGVVHSLLEIGLHVCGSIAAFETFLVLSNCIDWNSKTWFINLSSKTMPMYLFHQQIIYFSILLLNGRVNPYINSLLNLLIALIGSYIFSTVLMKWRVTRFLVGEKK